MFKKNEFFKNVNDIKNLKISIKGKNYVLNEGTHIINDPIIIPSGYDFLIKKGSTLRMSKQSYILVEGGSIKMDGTENYPITITSFNPEEVWKGIYVNSNAKITTIQFEFC